MGGGGIDQQPAIGAEREAVAAIQHAPGRERLQLVAERIEVAAPPMERRATRQAEPLSQFGQQDSLGRDAPVRMGAAEGHLRHGQLRPVTCHPPPHETAGPGRQVIERLSALVAQPPGIPDARAGALEHQPRLTEVGGRPPSGSLNQQHHLGTQFRHHGDSQLGPRGGGGRAQVRHEIRDSEVGLVSDRRDHGHRASGDGARDCLLVEGPQVFHRTAATSQNDHVDIGNPTQPLECQDDAGGGARPLYGRGREENGHREAAMRDADDVLKNGALGRGHHADPAGQERQGPLARGREQPGGLQLLLELLEGDRQGAGALRLDLEHRHLKAAAPLVDGQATAEPHRHSVLDLKTETARLARIHHTVQGRLIILEAEVEMPRARALESRDLSFHADLRESALQREPSGSDQLVHRKDARRPEALVQRGWRRRQRGRWRRGDDGRHHQSGARRRHRRGTRGGRRRRHEDQPQTELAAARGRGRRPSIRPRRPGVRFIGLLQSGRHGRDARGWFR